MDKLYLSQQGGLSLELVCSAPSNPPASLTWTRQDLTSGQWRAVGQEVREETTDKTGVWSVMRQVSLLHTSLGAGINYKIII